MASQRLKRFATFYVLGPEKGDVEAAAKRAGYKRPPSLSDPETREQIELLGGHVPLEAHELPTVADVVTADIELPPADATEEDWRRLAERLMPTYVAAAMGEARISPAQRQILQNIIDRHYGKAGQEKALRTQATNVVVLPSLYSGSAMVVCPVCRARLET